MKILIAENGQHVVRACRHMAKNGHYIIFASPMAHSRVNRIFFSKSYSEVVKIDNADNDTERIKQIKRVYNEKNCDVFYPFGFELVTDYINVSNNHKELKMNTPYGKYKNYWNLSDKHSLYRLLKDTDVLLPKLFGHVKFGKWTKLKEKDFPVIVKKTKGVGIKKNVILAWNNKDVNSFISNFSKNEKEECEFILQQYISGDIFDVGGFGIEGEIYCAIPQRRTVTLPLRGGVAAVNDIYDDQELIEIASTIINKAKWTGPFQAEFRHDPKSNKYYLLEINAKMWGSTPLSLKSNSNLLEIALNTAVGHKVEKNLNYKNELRYRWICSQELRAISMGSIMDLKDFFSRFCKKSYYDIDLNDPLPDLLRLLKTLFVIFFLRSNLPKPLVNQKTHERLNEIS